ncbi:hypothetical protein Cs7R123_78990 [Catellatospora sp. TT07R-123]|nr:hypothetical protein Cs7R123_78990 [Catellatospora sp. TT07R-123]
MLGVLAVAASAVPAYAAGGSDLAVGARPAVGKVNGVVGLELSIANFGPDQVGATVKVRFDYTAPPGTRFVGGFEGEDCNLREDSTRAECYTVGPWPGVAPDGKAVWRTVQVRIDGPVTGRGSLKVTCSCDPNAANDQVPLLVNDPGPAPSATPQASPAAASAPARSSMAPSVSPQASAVPVAESPDSGTGVVAVPEAVPAAADPDLSSASRTLIIVILCVVLIGLLALAVAVYVLRRGAERDG